MWFSHPSFLQVAKSAWDTLIGSLGGLLASVYHLTTIEYGMDQPILTEFELTEFKSTSDKVYLDLSACSSTLRDYLGLDRRLSLGLVHIRLEFYTLIQKYRK